jgi:hypothetical protein
LRLNKRQLHAHARPRTSRELAGIVEETADRERWRRGAFRSKHGDAPFLHGDLPVERHQVDVRRRRDRQRAFVGQIGNAVGERPGQRRRLLRREIEDGIQPRLLERPCAAGELEFGLCPGDAQIGLQDIESRRRARFEHRLGHVAHPPRDLDQAVGQPDPLVGGDHRVERLTQLAPHGAQFGLHIHIGQRQFFLRQFDAASALAAQLDRHFKNKDLVWGVA